MKAIDLYSGIGGWSIGLVLNDIEVVNSFEWWLPAVETANQNLGKNEVPVDIRNLDFKSLPKNIDIVVGSPPCTQFSYSNRGGSGDIEDGIIDLFKFFECVSILKPKFWAMENVPRVKGVIQSQIQKGGQLAKFRSIIQDGFVEIFDMSEFGVPQKRKRCIASNINIKLLNEYKEKYEPKTLGQVVASFKKNQVKDINYNLKIHKNKITETEKEEPLNLIETRMNMEMKTNHPVYNNMNFPENMKKPCRTITATCTRVSRESVVIKDGSKFRRLSVRERSSVQGFPINYEFFGSSHSQKLKMIGNAVPPPFTYAVAAAMKNINPKKFEISDTQDFFSLCNKKSLKTHPEKQGKKFSKSRSFRYSPKSLRFKSGVRFELSNKSSVFEFNFVYGDSKNIQYLELDKKVFRFLKAKLEYDESLASFFSQKKYKKITFKSSDLQSVWINEQNGLHPFDVIDEINNLVEDVLDKILDLDSDFVEKLILKFFNDKKFFNKKIDDNKYHILAGLILTSSLNFYSS